MLSIQHAVTINVNTQREDVQRTSNINTILTDASPDSPMYEFKWWIELALDPLYA